MLKQRFFTGIILAPMVVALVVMGPPVVTAGVLGCAGLLCLMELLRMMIPGRTLEQAGTLLVTAAALAVVYQWPEFLPYAAVAIMFSPAGLVLLRPKPLETAAARMAACWAGIAYVGGATAFLMETSREPGHIMMTLVVVWSGDTGAYFAGRALGRHKLYPLISPNKTWEGSIGGVLASILGAYIIHLTMLPDLDLTTLLLVSILGGAVAQIGDLVESAFKRSCGVKDSGQILPGHGGMLDRLDGVMFSAPIFALIL